MTQQTDTDDDITAPRREGLDGDVLPKGSRLPHAIDGHVGSRLRMRRQVMGLSLIELAERCGVSYQQVQKYENGDNRVSASNLFLLASALRVTVDYFFFGVEGRLEPPWDGLADAQTKILMNTIDSDVALEKDLAKMSFAFYRIEDPNVRSKIIELVKALLPADVDEPRDPNRSGDAL